MANIKLELDHDPSGLLDRIARKLGLPQSEIIGYEPVRKALDARKKDRIVFVYTVDVELTSKWAGIVSRRKIADVTMRVPDRDEGTFLTATRSMMRPVIIGAGPAGLFAGLTLARNGYRPIVLERGQDVDSRVRDIEQFWFDRLLNPESNVQFGEGGAGTFSDGKLTTRINDDRVRCVLKDLVEAGAPPEIMYLNKPHIGTDKLRAVVKNLRHLLTEMGGVVHFNSRVSGLVVENGEVRSVIVNDEQELDTQAVVLAIGHSARDTYKMLAELGCPVEQKAFSIGVRVEHRQPAIDQAQYGSSAGHPSLGAADYQLVHKNEGLDRAAYTFCMCPGGRVVAAASEENTVVTNGMSDYARDTGAANSAVVVSVNPDDFGSSDPLAGIDFQRKWERAAFQAGGGNYNAPAQLMEDFLAGRASNSLNDAAGATYQPGLTPADLHRCLPDYVTSTLAEALAAFDRKLKGFAAGNALLTGVETRTSAPVRLVRDANRQSTGIEGLFPAGEGAGYAGGIVSAAVDGMRVAEAIIDKYRD